MDDENNRKKYNHQWDIVDSFFSTNEPEGFGALITPEEEDALRVYYFVSIDGQDIYERRERLVKYNPTIVRAAIAAARRIALAEGLTAGDVKELFS
ncbi:MAG: hypothetical protein QM753_00810 [Thermomicrobiales bacterium]